MGGFYLPEVITNRSQPTANNLYLFTFHGQDPDPTSQLEPGPELSQAELLKPLSELAAQAGEKIYWMKSTYVPAFSADFNASMNNLP